MLCVSRDEAELERVGNATTMAERQMADAALERMGASVGECDDYLDALSESTSDQVRAAIVEAWEARQEALNAVIGVDIAPQLAGPRYSLSDIKRDRERKQDSDDA